ncbi:MAG: hypothetical protein ABW163_03865 [Luteimonas sp.]
MDVIGFLEVLATDVAGQWDAPLEAAADFSGLGDVEQALLARRDWPGIAALVAAPPVVCCIIATPDDGESEMLPDRDEPGSAPDDDESEDEPARQAPD